jgi:hypothetical protein
LLLSQGRSAEALREYRAALEDAPGRRGALMGEANASKAAMH